MADKPPPQPKAAPGAKISASAGAANLKPVASAGAVTLKSTATAGAATLKPAASAGAVTLKSTAGSGPASVNAKPKPISRPPAYRSRQSHRGRRLTFGRVCCCCCFWSIIVLLVLSLITAVAATALYFLYHPRQPTFSVPSLRIHRLNLTTSPDDSSASLSALFNLTLISKNNNSHLTLSYEPFAISILSLPHEVLLGNGTVPAFFSGENAENTFRAVTASSSPAARGLDASEAEDLKADLRPKTRVELKIVMDTKVEVRMGKLRSRKVGIRVSCEGFKGSVPKGGKKNKNPAMASTDESKCKVDLRIKVWNWTFKS